MKTIVSILFLTISYMINAQSLDSTSNIFINTKKANDYSLEGHLNKDIDQIISVYSKDAIISPPGGIKPIEGINEIRKFYLNGFEQGTSLKITTENISYQIINESHVTEMGKYYILYQKKGETNPIEISGYMLIAWVKNENGHWKIKYDMWH